MFVLSLKMTGFPYSSVWSLHTTTLCILLPTSRPFWTNYGFHPSFLPNIIPEASVPAVQDRISFTQANYQTLRESMQKDQEDYKRQYDKRRRENPIFKVGDKVCLSSTNVKLSCPSQKLGPKCIGPFEKKEGS